jgi:hypothetical protein
MNRATRRALARAQPQPIQRHRPGKINKPHLDEVYRAFAPIEEIFDALRTGSVDSLGDIPVIRSESANMYYEMAPSIAGWVDCWELMRVKLGFDVDLVPVAQLAAKLKSGEPLTVDELDAAYAAVDRCRRIYRSLDVYEVRSIVRTQQIKHEMEMS